MPHDAKKFFCFAMIRLAEFYLPSIVHSISYVIAKITQVGTWKFCVYLCFDTFTFETFYPTLSSDILENTSSRHACFIQHTFP